MTNYLENSHEDTRAQSNTKGFIINESLVSLSLCGRENKKELFYWKFLDISIIRFWGDHGESPLQYTWNNCQFCIPKSVGAGLCACPDRSLFIGKEC